MKIVDELVEDDENSPTKIRIEFSVGSERDGRWITFGDNVELENIEEWFSFTGQAVSRMFNVGTTRPWHVGYSGAAMNQINSSGYSSVVPNKIAAIKAVREFTGCGLKTAKDAIELLFRGTIALCESRATAIALRDRLTGEAGSNVGTFEMSRVSPKREQEIRGASIYGLKDLYIPKKK